MSTASSVSFAARAYVCNDMLYGLTHALATKTDVVDLAGIAH